jgi:ataxia telangiectasia mutated family protein
LKFSKTDITIGRIQSSAATERKDGLADLEHIFRHNKNSSALERLKDKTWHSIFDALLECTTIERSYYLKSNASQRTKSTAITRLEACGKALRTTVTAGVRKIRAKTVKALLDHILQILPTPAGYYCEGLSHDYVKCLSIICEYQPHVEHLRKTWYGVVDFCTAGVALLQDPELEPSPMHNSNGSSSLRTLTVSMARRSRDGTPQPARVQRSSAFRTELDDLILCLYHLTRATNAPVAERASPILTALVQYLHVSDSVRIGHHSAFAAINSVLFKIGASSFDVTHTTLLEVYPLIKELWQSKSTSLRDEMLITLILTRNHISSILSQPDGAGLAMHIENLLETLQADYGRRLQRDQLQLKDIHLVWKSYSGRTSFLDFPTLQLRGRNIQSESHWSVLYLMAYYVHVLDMRKNKSDERSNQDENEDARKRRRRSSLLEDVICQTSIGFAPSKICALQILVFHSFVSLASPSKIREIIDAVTPMIADQHGPTASWAMIAVARYELIARNTSLLLSLCSFSIQKTARNTDLSSVWVNVFNLAARKVATASTCRAASHLMNVLLNLNIVRYLSVATVVETILSSVELHGPASFGDSSAFLWITFMKAKAAENPSASAALSDRILRWLFGKWIPSEYENMWY